MLPKWKDADECYSKSYRLLERMAQSGHVTMSGTIGRHGYQPCCVPSKAMNELIKALDKGDEEAIKKAMLRAEKILNAGE